MFKTAVFWILFTTSCVNCQTTTTCVLCNAGGASQEWVIETHSNAKNTYNNYNGTIKATDCADVIQMGHNKSAVYKIWPMNRLTEGKSLDVYCDMDTDGGGWTVIQRRGDFKRPIDYFFKDWKNYKEGFGDIEKDFWLGNENIFALTNQKLYSARFDLKDFAQDMRYAQYDTFWIEDENRKYMLRLSDYSGNAGDAMTKEHKDQKFSTKDQDNDQKNDQHCAQLYKGGWWYSNCHQANLNGLYHLGKNEINAEGINWFQWKGYNETLQWTEIKIRPKNFHRTIKKY